MDSCSIGLHYKFNPSITIRDVDRKKTSFNPSTTSINYQENVETSKICEELLRRQPNTSTGTPMELDPGQPVFVKEVSGNVWKTTTVDQPAAELDSYWMRFPDNSILRRTRSMNQTQVCTFSFQATG